MHIVCVEDCQAVNRTDPNIVEAVGYIETFLYFQQLHYYCILGAPMNGNGSLSMQF